MSSYEKLVKLLMIGDSGVGKSCLLLRFTEGSFSSSFITTIGIDFKIKVVDVDGKKVKLQIWDTAGQERFRTITSAYYRGAMGIILVYDSTNEQSFQNIRNWMRNIEENASESVCKILLGNKSDCLDEKIIDSDMGQALANEYGVKFLETSAKSDVNVSEAFLGITREVIMKNKSQNALISTTALGSQKSKRNGNCCQS